MNKQYGHSSFDRPPITFEKDGGTLGCRIVNPRYFPATMDQYRQELYRELRRDFSEKLLSAIEQTINPVVVSIEYEVIKMDDGSEALQYVADFTPVEHRRIIVTNFPEPSFSMLKQANFYGRLKYLFTGKV